MKRIALILCSCLFLFSADASGLREIKIGDKLPDKEQLAAFKKPGSKAILYIKSTNLKSIAFFKTFARLLGDKKETADLTLFVVDASPVTDQRVTTVLDSIKIKKQLIQDEDRKIYGSLGVIVIPSLVLVSGDDTLHSLVAGYRANLPMFFKSHLGTLLQGKSAGNVYKSGDELLQKRKSSKMLKQAFHLLANRDFDLAGSIYKKSLELAPENIEAQLGMGYSLFLAEKTGESLDYFGKLKTKNKSKRILLGYYLSKYTKEPSEEDLSQIAALSQLEPRFYFICFHAGALLEKAGKCEQSSAVFKHSYSVLLRNHRRNK